MLDYDYVSTPYIDFQHGIIKANFAFIVKDGIFYSKSYHVSVSVGLKRDWCDYRNDSIIQLDSNILKAGSAIIGVLGGMKNPAGIVISAYGYITSKALEAHQDGLEELTKILLISGHGDDELLGIVSSVWKFESKYSWTKGEYIDSTSSVDNIVTYLFAPCFCRYPI